MTRLGGPHDVMVKVVSEFELQSRYYVHFQKFPWDKYEPPYLPSYGLSIVLLLYCPRRMDLALNNPRRLICH